MFTNKGQGAYFGLPSPLWYQYVEEIDEEENTSDNTDTSVTTE